MKKLALSAIAVSLLAAIALPAVSAREADAPAESLSPTPVISGNTQIPNPFVDCNTMQDAAKITGFSLAAPEAVCGYTIRTIQVMDSTMIQAVYQNAQGKQIVFRKAAGNGDISGDFNQYDQVTHETIGGVFATVKRSNARAYITLWNQDGYSYSIQSSHGLDNAALEHLIQAKEPDQGNVQIPNPFVTCNTLDEAAAMTGFPLSVPETVPGFPERSIQVMNRSMMEVTHHSPDNQAVLIRKAPGNEDISGDYHAYSETTTHTINGAAVSFKGQNGKVSLATWQNQGYTYSIGVYGEPASGLSSSTMSQLVASVR